MKTIRKYIALSFLAVFMLSSCEDFLDVKPKDKMQKDQQFSSEENINNTLNGLYRLMIRENLYGGQMTQTTLDFMAHYYTYSPSRPNDGSVGILFYELGNFNYSWGNNRLKFTHIWDDAYATALNINLFIKGLNETNATMSEQHKNIMLGEAYGLRAYIHFDLLRLFGPIYRERTNEKVLPYHNTAQITLNHEGYEEDEYSTVDEYVQLLLKDIETASELLKDNDPIVSDANSITNELSKDFYENRNRRMNYYAVKGLEARIYQYIGEDSKAAAAAHIITEQVGAQKAFNWVDPNKIASTYNYIFFSEVIFGINNLDMSSHAKTYYLGEDIYSLYVVDYNNLTKNIFKEYGTGLGSILDCRAKQWVPSNIKSSPGYSLEGTYISSRYTANSSFLPAIKELQPLMRISEMYYIQAEAALKAGDKASAIGFLNQVLQNRGLTNQYYLTESKTDEEIRAHIEREYYREFFGEGQVFFFHKRNMDTQMFKAYEGGSADIADITKTYVVPIPDEEKNI
jgi:hypothetical protein